LGALLFTEQALRALVVDDSAVIRELIAVNLELEGFEVTMAGDGETALELARETQPDVITLDVMMPRMTGFEAVERLRADPETARVPVVMVTGRAQAADIARGEETGADAYLTKPFEPAELIEVVTRLARSHRSAR
jgi:CheY-like chemotaxis protein